MRWIMLAVSLLGFAISFSTASVAVLVLGLLLAIGGMIGAVFAFAAARVESVSQGQSSRELSILLDAKKSKLEPGVRPQAAQAAQAARPATPARQPPPQRAERGVEIHFASGGYSTAGAKSRSRADQDHDRADAAGDGGDGGGGGGD